MVDPATEEQQHKDYSCHRCRKVLFRSADIMPHTSKQKKYNARADKQTSAIQYCSSWFIEIADWMAIPQEETV